MNKIESPNGNNFAITKEVMMLMKQSLDSIYSIYSERNDVPNDSYNYGVIISGIKEVQGTIENPAIQGTMSAGLVYFKGELFEFKSSVYQTTFSIVENIKTITGSDLNNNPYSTILKERYLVFDAAGLYPFSNLLRAEIADRKSLFALSYPNMDMSYLNANFTRATPNQNKSVFVVDQFGKLYNNQIIKAIDYVSGTTDIELMTLPAQYRPKVPSGFDRMYFTAYLKRVDQSPVRTYPLTMYIIPTTGAVYLQTEGNSFNVNGDDLIYINIEYFVS